MKDRGAELILAAGGVVDRTDGSTHRFAVVHKAKYGTWGLPKGKLSAGEDWAEAALREVAEETGTIAEITGPRAISSYFLDGTPKVVLWFRMRALDDIGFAASHEIDAVDWLTEPNVLDRLTHATERRAFQDLAGQ